MSTRALVGIVQEDGTIDMMPSIKPIDSLVKKNQRD